MAWRRMTSLPPPAPQLIRNPITSLRCRLTLCQLDSSKDHIPPYELPRLAWPGSRCQSLLRRLGGVASPHTMTPTHRAKSSMRPTDDILGIFMISFQHIGYQSQSHPRPEIRYTVNIIHFLVRCCVTAGEFGSLFHEMDQTVLQAESIFLLYPPHAHARKCCEQHKSGGQRLASCGLLSLIVQEPHHGPCGNRNSRGLQRDAARALHRGYVPIRRRSGLMLLVVASHTSRMV
mmetsp:Transcript_37042/g.97027  ORF Transcript_37042/g.97027 Transcript_37042/m.97027 type:complete len:232 (-) Transcript_37042:91-786(-)